MKTSIRANGEGSLFQRKDGLWCGAVTIGYDSKTGKQKRKYFYNKNKDIVRKQVNQLVYELDNDIYNEGSEMALKNYLIQWLEDKKDTVATNTWEYYNRNVKNHIIPEIGNIRLKDLNNRHIQDLLNKKKKTGNLRSGGGLSPESIRHIYRTLSVSLRQAVERDILIKNPAKKIELPKKEKKAPKFLTKQQIRKLYSTVQDDILYYTIIKLSILTGLRRGEVLGLTWNDIEFKNKLLNIRSQITKTQKETASFEAELKTYSSVRKIILSKSVVNLLKKYKEEYYNSFGSNINDPNHGLSFVFIKDKEGNPLKPDYVSKKFKEIVRKANLPDISFHDMRHTFATLHLEAGVNIKKIQRLMGHSSIKTTMDIYAHITRGIDEETLNIMEKVSKDTEIA